MTDSPLLTICVLCHNSEKFLEKTLNSIINQTYPNFEIIISDNYSTDSTPEIAKSFQKKYQKITYVKNEKPSQQDQDYIGCYENYNSCIKSGLIRGDFVAFCHDDDLYDKNIFKEQISFLTENQTAGAVFTMANKITRDDKLIGYFKLPRDLTNKKIYGFEDIFKSLLSNGNNFLITPSFLARTSVISNAGSFDEKKYRTSADLEMWLRILEKCNLGIVDKRLLNYRIGGGSKKYQRLRTERSDFFTVMDYYLEKAKKSLKIDDQLLRQYEFQKYIDDTLLAINFLAKNDLARAKEIIKKPAPFDILRALTENFKLLRAKILALRLVLFIGINTGLGKSLARILLKIT